MIMCYRSVLLVYLNMSLTGNHYVALVCNHLQPFMNCMYPNNDRLFQQNNALCHLSQVATAKSINGILEKSIYMQDPAPKNREILIVIKMVITQYFSSGLPTTCGIHVTSSSCTSLSKRLNFTRYCTNPISWNSAHPYIEPNYILLK